MKREQRVAAVGVPLAQAAMRSRWMAAAVSTCWRRFSPARDSGSAVVRYGTKQVTDAYLLGLAVRDGLVLVTMNKAILHLAGKEHTNNALLLEK